MINFTPASIRTWSRLGSNASFGLAAKELALIEDNLVILTADLCTYSGLDRFKAEFPDKLHNCGIAEQNMLGVAAGLAKEGFTPFATTYATFASLRCGDQVRVNMGIMKLPIKLVGLSGGLSAGILGATHMSVEDVAVMRAIPNITVISPADCTETVKATLAAAKLSVPVFIRLTGTMNIPIVYQTDYDYEIGKSITLRRGSDICIVATGTMVHTSLLTADILEQKGISCTVIDMHTLQPLDTSVIDDAISCRLIVTVEEHSVVGGLGSAVAEHLALKRTRPQHLIVGIPRNYPSAGEYEYLLERCGLTPSKISSRIMKVREENV